MNVRCFDYGNDSFLRYLFLNVLTLRCGETEEYGEQKASFQINGAEEE